jgi:hypothetical protein
MMLKAQQQQVRPSGWGPRAAARHRRPLAPALLEDARRNQLARSRPQAIRSAAAARPSGVWRAAPARSVRARAEEDSSKTVPESVQEVRTVACSRLAGASGPRGSPAAAARLRGAATMSGG